MPSPIAVHKWLPAGPQCRAVLTAISISLSPIAGAFAQSSAIRLWRDDASGADIRITADNQGILTGRIAAVRDSVDANGRPPRDEKNPDAQLRSRPILGLPMLTGMKATAANTWDGGEIYDARSGKTYRASMRLTHPDTLRVRGYVKLGVVKVGRTAVWVRVPETGQPR